MSADWRTIYEADDQTIEADIDIPSYAITATTIEVWFKTTFKEDKKLSNGKVYNKTRDLTRFDCSNGRTAGLQVIYYYNNENVHSWEISDLSKVTMLRAIPDSIGEMQLKKTCVHKKLISQKK